MRFCINLNLIIAENDIMAKTACTVPITQIILDERIYPRSSVYPKRISMFVENIQDGFKIDPLEVQIHPEYDDKYRILDGAHRWNAYKEIGATEIPVHIKVNGVKSTVDPCSKLIRVKSRLDPIYRRVLKLKNTTDKLKDRQKKYRALLIRVKGRLDTSRYL